MEKAIPSSVVTRLMVSDHEGQVSVFARMESLFLTEVQKIVHLTDFEHASPQEIFEKMSELTRVLDEFSLHGTDGLRALSHDLRGILATIWMQIDTPDLIPREQFKVLNMRLCAFLDNGGDKKVQLRQILQTFADRVLVNLGDAGFTVDRPNALFRALHNLVHNAFQNKATHVGIWFVSAEDFKLADFQGGFIKLVELRRWKESDGWGLLVRDDGPGVAEGRNLLSKAIKTTERGARGNGIRIAAQQLSSMGGWLFQLNSGPQANAEEWPGLAWLVALPGQA